MPSILDPKFRYVDSHSTDLRKTFARVRRELRDRQPAKPKPAAETSRVVTLERARKACS